MPSFSSLDDDRVNRRKKTRRNFSKAVSLLDSEIDSSSTDSDGNSPSGRPASHPSLRELRSGKHPPLLHASSSPCFFPMRDAILKTQHNDHSPAAINVTAGGSSVRGPAHSNASNAHLSRAHSLASVHSQASVHSGSAHGSTHGSAHPPLRKSSSSSVGLGRRKSKLAFGMNQMDFEADIKASFRSSKPVLDLSLQLGALSLATESPTNGTNGRPEEIKEEGDFSALPLGAISLDPSYGLPSAPSHRSAKDDLSYNRAKKSKLMIPVVHPAAPTRMKWDVVLAIILIWNVIEIPFQVCFSVEADCLTFYDFFGFALDVFFICDVIVNFHTGFFDDGKYVDDADLVAWHYLKSGFPLDFVTSIPYGRILNLVGGSFCAPVIEDGEASNSNLAVLPRLLRIFRIFKLVKLFRLVKLMSVISSWEEAAGVGLSSALRMLTLFFYVIFLSHIAGCLFGLIALNAQADNDGVFPEEGWVARYSTSTNDERILASKARLYVLSFYWAITTLTTVGYGDVLPFTTGEIVLTVIVQFVGTMVFAYIMASITSVVSSEDVTATLIKQKKAELNEYMDHRELGVELKARIKAHYEYQWKRTTIFDEEQILESLPPFLRMDVACSMNLDLVKNVPVLLALGDDCMAMVVTKLKPLQLTPGEKVVRKGTVGHEMYFITEGILDVYIDEEDMVPKCSLTQGSYFGEPAILSSKPVKRSATIQARVFSQLESLSKIDFLAVSLLFPDILKMLSEVQTLSGQKEVTQEEGEQHVTFQNTRLILKSLKVIMLKLEDLEDRMDAGDVGPGTRAGSGDKSSPGGGGGDGGGKEEKEKEKEKEKEAEAAEEVDNVEIRTLFGRKRS